jgi:TrmH family RNA methyltransferase
VPNEGPTLSSVNNPHVKYARSLHVRKNRYRERSFLVEGVRLVLDALDAGAVPSRVYLREAFANDQVNDAVKRLATSQVPVHRCTDAVITAIADTQTPQGVVAVFPFPDLPARADLATPLLLVVDGLKDPGNLGTLMRAALGAGVTGLYLSPQTVDPYAPKVVRAAMGAHFRLPLLRFNWDDVPKIMLECANRHAAEACAKVAYDQVDWRQPSALMVGSEAVGLSKEARTLATRSVAIPLSGGLESLNAGIAGAVILFEAARQRRSQ